MNTLKGQSAQAATSHSKSLALRVFSLVGLSLLAIALYLQTASDAHAQRAGQSTTIRTGTVTGMRTVNLQDGNATGGAVTGGAIGAALSRNSSSRKRNRNAAIGAILGSAAASSRTRQGRVYTVTTSDNSMIQVATEQTAIAIGDCVYVEQAGGGTNLRRAPMTACEPETQPVLQDKAVQAELQEDADLCFAARRELAEAEEDAAFDLAVRKVKLLCYE